MAIIGVGNALTDIIVKIEDDRMINDLGVAKGGMYMIDVDRHHQLVEMLSSYDSECVAGGSTANTISGLANLGAKVAYIGNVGCDDTGIAFRESQSGVGIRSMLGVSQQTPSGKCISLVTPDGERTMISYLGAALELDGQHLTPEHISPYGIILVEGYLLYSPDLIRHAMETARQAGLQIALDAASFNVVDDCRGLINELIDTYVDILFANEDEAMALTGTDDPKAAFEALAARCKWVVVKVGAEGSLVAHGADRIHVGVIDAVVYDKTGAGDLYAAGFLYGLSRGLDIDKCGRIGAVVSSRSIEFAGAQIPCVAWPEIIDMVSRIEQGENICSVTRL